MTPTILRCTALGEVSFLERENEAYIIDPQEENIPEGYPLYLFVPEDHARWNNLQNAFQLPQGYSVGSFIEYDEENTLIKPCFCADIPDRTIFLTALCNSNCIMCPYTENYRVNSVLEPIDLIERYIDLMSPDAEYLCITGGEPTLQKEFFFRILKKVREHFKSVVVHILTNGRTFYYQDFVDGFRAVRPYKTVLGIPLHASNAALHDMISQAPGSFDQTIKGIEKLLKHREHVEVRVVTSALNKTDLPDLAQMISRRFSHVHHVCFMGLEMMGNAFIHREDVWCQYEEIWPYVKEATRILLTAGVDVELYNYPLCHIDKKYWPIYHRSITPCKVKYLEPCDSCKKKDECGGFFETTIHMQGISVYPQ